MVLIPFETNNRKFKNKKIEINKGYKYYFEKKYLILLCLLRNAKRCKFYNLRVKIEY